MNKKKSKNKTLFLTQWLLIFALCFSSTVTWAVPQNDDVIASLIREMSARLELTGEQVTRIKSVLSAAQDQMIRDREMFRGNEPALIETAKKRRDMTEAHIEAVLDAGQREKYTEAREIIHLDDYVVSLMEILAMKYSQAYKTAEIITMEKKQAQLDRQTYKKSALALISSARARREMTDSHIRDVLNAEQQQKFYIFKQKRDVDIEFFELKEGLILDREQIVKVEQILKDFREKAEKDKKKRGRMGMGMGMPGGGGGKRGGGMGGGGMMPGMGGGRGGMGGRGMGRGGRSPNHDMMKKMKEREEKKANAIIKILTPEQIQLYDQLLHKRKQDMETRMQQMMQKMR